jgi:2-oxo-4-hydroxy-4-carboxy-5-ureidoimidazoline decarboxylase
MEKASPSPVPLAAAGAKPVRLSVLNAIDRAAFAAALGAIFEHSPWVAEASWEARPFADTAALHRAMSETVMAASEEQKVALLRAHPDLAGKAARAGDLTDHSRSEQAGAGLDSLSDDEYELFHGFNDAYREKFGFPFIIAVRRATKQIILDEFERRLALDRDSEIETALKQVCEIARFRLQVMVIES